MNPEMFPDKKERHLSYDEMSAYFQQGRDFMKEWEIGQKEATVVLRPEYESLPAFILLMTDTHFGSIRTNHDLIEEHLSIVEHTPNFFMVHNGDHTDNFNANKHASGMSEDPLPPQLTARGWEQRFINLDRKSKLIAMGFGNHDLFTFEGSQSDYYDTFMGQFQCPVFTEGGVIHIMYGSQIYHLAFSHTYWGRSKLNGTNAVKRFIDFEYPYADIGFLGHVHTSEGLHFEKGGKDRIAVIGGTYKLDDPFARVRGIGGRSGFPGWVVAIWPDKRQMQLFKDTSLAEETMVNLMSVFGDEPYIDPYTNMAK